ncbi:MAG: cupin domain-containing protein [Nitrososphaerota archaeon]
MQVFPYQSVKAIEAEEGALKVKVRWLITKEIGAENFAMRLFEIEPEGYTPLHEHPWEHEVFILEGEGMVIGGDKEKKFKEGDVVFIPPGEKHQFRNTGKRIVKLLCLIPYTHK